MHTYNSDTLNQIFQPRIFRLNNQEDNKSYQDLLSSQPLFISDDINSQLTELISSRNPSVRMQETDYDTAIQEHLNGQKLEEYGVWVYYPWSARLVHLLDEPEFIELRTNRNQYKIMRQERDILATKKIGIIGLSVGQSIALTLVMERSCGELRLADFDTLALSNLNRIRTGVHNLGVPKVVIAAREIAEMDPFIKIKCFFDGLTAANMDDFFTKDGLIDILVDECDGLDVKILSRYKARELGIPVVMDTSDRGMLDIERFDLERDRPILHGMAEGLNPSNIKAISNEDKVPIVLQMLGVDNISIRAKASLVEVEQSIKTWPQLASSVALGGAAGADTCRRILLNQLQVSGRFYIDFEDIIKEKTPSDASLAQSSAQSSSRQKENNPFSPLREEEMIKIISTIRPMADANVLKLPEEKVRSLVAAACQAPSTGNDQPWKWLYQNGSLYLFQDQHRSYSFGDFENTASYISFGAAYENLHIHALQSGLAANCHLMDKSHHPLVAVIQFNPLTEAVADRDSALPLLSLDEYIYERVTNRNQHLKADIPDHFYTQLTRLGQSIQGAKVRFFTDDDTIKALGEIIGFCDRVRLLDSSGHFDFVHREMRWTPEESASTRDGIDIQTLGLSQSQMAALKVIKSEAVIETLNQIGGGKAMEALAHRTVKTATAVCLVTFPDTGLDSYFEGGRAMERLWLSATELNLAVHPLISPLYLFTRLEANGAGLDPTFVPRLKEMQARFSAITGMQSTEAGVFLAKIAVAPAPKLKSFRLPLEKTLILK